MVRLLGFTELRCDPSHSSRDLLLDEADLAGAETWHRILNAI
jgi:hypothetical protein